MSFTCPKCGRVSHNPNDAKERYCGACHEFFDEHGPEMDEAQRLARLAGLHDNLGAEMAGLGGVLRCDRCKREMPMRGAAGYLRSGWPECCGYTMTWVTAR